MNIGTDGAEKAVLWGKGIGSEDGEGAKKAVV